MKLYYETGVPESIDDLDAVLIVISSPTSSLLLYKKSILTVANTGNDTV